MQMSRIQDPALISGFYEAAADPSCWAPTWAAVCRAFEAPAGLLVHQPDGGVAPRILASTNWRGEAPLMLDGKACYRSIVGREMLGPSLSDDALLDEFCAPFAGAGAFHVLAASVPLGGTGRAGLGLHRPIDTPAFGEADRAALDSISRHLAAALRLSAQLEAERLASAVRGAALDGLRHGAVIAAADATVLFANEAALRMADDGGLLLGGDTTSRISCEQPDEAARLAALVWDAAEGGEGGCARISRAGRRAVLAAVVSPLPPGPDDTRSGNLALVSLRDLGDTSDATETHLMDLFGLTAAEAGILPQLLAGDSAALIAQSRGVQVATVRTQAARVLAKTGASNLRALASMVAALG